MRERLKSFKHAIHGLKVLVTDEPNARIHLAAAVLVIVAGCVIELELSEWVAVSLAIGLVLVTEIINSAIEKLADIVSPERHEEVKKLKDLSAAAVLLSALTAVAIAAMLFLPKIMERDGPEPDSSQQEFERGYIKVKK